MWSATRIYYCTRQLGRLRITWLSIVQQHLKQHHLTPLKQQIWLRTALCGGWCRRMALCNLRVACQKRRRYLKQHCNQDSSQAVGYLCMYDLKATFVITNNHYWQYAVIKLNAVSSLLDASLSFSVNNLFLLSYFLVLQLKVTKFNHV